MKEPSLKRLHITYDSNRILEKRNFRDSRKIDGCQDLKKHRAR